MISFPTMFFLKYLFILNIQHDNFSCLELEPEKGIGYISFIKGLLFRENLKGSEESNRVERKDFEQGYSLR